jgi:2-amino-4-hydroxy-6-hydroxymethyldihydropteridine diphosphokinase
MAYSLLALGSNLGDRSGTLRRALTELSHLSATRLLARSSVHETTPVGGPAGQGAFLNAAALVRTALSPVDLLQELRQIETALGRQRAEQWAARSIDLDVLLYDDAVIAAADLRIPHPRMAYRRFVLEPAAEIAGPMLHPESGWTIDGLLSHLGRAENVVAVAASSAEGSSGLVAALSQRLGLRSVTSGRRHVSDQPAVVTWPDAPQASRGAPPKLLLALSSGGVDSRAARRMLHLPVTGPIAWIAGDAASALGEAVAAVQAVWPELAE